VPKGVRGLEAESTEHRAEGREQRARARAKSRGQRAEIEEK
jgi:hypothetical protein